MYEWQEMIDEFINDIEIKGYSKVTIYNYRYKLKNIQDYFISQGINKIDNITKQDIKKWIAFLQAQGKQASTINVTVNRLSRVFNYMFDEEYINVNVFKKIRQLKTQKKIIYPLNDSEIKQMLLIASKHKYKHIALRNVVLFSMMLDCGLRISEVANLKNEDVLENQIIVRNSKNNKDRALAITPILKKQMLKYDRIKKNRYKTDDYQYYFVSYQLCKLSEKSIWDMMQRIKEQMDVRNVVRFSGHTLRHTYAHMQMRNGMDIYTLSKNMGHSSVTMTQNYLQTLKSDDFVKESIKYSTLQNLR
ncbi:tyrosine-type recombinase/integrase [Pseudolactococcus raffinolactis]|uniref:tyrosine-type recombinase/integrase n=1 Tax=Pseudolactococcus raffinolactis TaxID=1366 RepID=UPI0014372550|nr:tyrosine-type recombinase/integrase [Lactococcus raffinolactis]QIW56493.1 tyrosine-type recombinase/integrase [Lactococcus raffinolactis]